MIAEGGTSSTAWVVAHRGASRECPENTLAAFDEALRQGSDGIELDLQLSRDGIPVVYHDRTLAKAGLRGRKVSDLTMKELRRLRPGASFDPRFDGERIPILEQVLRRYGRRTRLLLEIKTRDDRPRCVELARKTVELVRRFELADRAYILSFDSEVLDHAASIATDVRRVFSVRPTPRLRSALRRSLPLIHALGVDVRTLTRAFSTAVRNAGCPLWVFTCNTPANVSRAVEAGAACILSDRPAWLARRLGRRIGTVPAPR